MVAMPRLDLIVSVSWMGLLSLAIVGQAVLLYARHRMATRRAQSAARLAYATEEILRVLIPAVGVAAFALVMPVTIAVVVVEAILIFSYRQTIKAYPSAGGAYIVTKDNLGLLPAQLAGVALLVDYVLTVA